MRSKDYKPALTQEEERRSDELVIELEKLVKREEEIKKELRRLIYKIERIS